MLGDEKNSYRKVKLTDWPGVSHLQTTRLGEFKAKVRCVGKSKKKTEKGQNCLKIK